MWLVLGLLIGLLLGAILPFDIPFAYSKYVSVAFLAGLDAVLAGAKSALEKKFDLLNFIVGFVINALLAALLTYLGDRLGVDMYLAAIVTFGVRIFQNLDSIRGLILEKPLREVIPVESMENSTTNTT
ncbi:MAG: small basic family protein [Candidatus Eremiobacteraeota bacterium]|nr:small basic family protein [Candidatus Eremiobacteraeota bacterium]